MRTYQSALLHASLHASRQIIMGMLLLHPGLTHAQESPGRITVDQDRPLYRAAQQLAEQTRTIITFEEMAFEYQGDLMEWADRRGDVKLIPKYGIFDFEYQPGTSAGNILRAMVDQYNAEYPGNYKVAGDGDAFHIVPDASKDALGNFVSRKSLLDTVVTLDFASNNAHDRVCDIVKQAATDNGIDLPCITDLAALSSINIENFNTTGEVARDVLVDILKQSGGNRSWVILRGNTGQYAISFIGQPNQ